MAIASNHSPFRVLFTSFISSPVVRLHSKHIVNYNSIVPASRFGCHIRLLTNSNTFTAETESEISKSVTGEAKLLELSPIESIYSAFHSTKNTDDFERVMKRLMRRIVPRKDIPDDVVQSMLRNMNMFFDSGSVLFFCRTIRQFSYMGFKLSDFDETTRTTILTMSNKVFMNVESAENVATSCIVKLLRGLAEMDFTLELFKSNMLQNLEKALEFVLTRCNEMELQEILSSLGFMNVRWNLLSERTRIYIQFGIAKRFDNITCSALHSAMNGLIKMNSSYNDYNADVKQTIIKCANSTIHSAPLRWKYQLSNALSGLLVPWSDMPMPLRSNLEEVCMKTLTNKTYGLLNLLEFNANYTSFSASMKKFLTRELPSKCLLMKSDDFKRIIHGLGYLGVKWENFPVAHRQNLSIHLETTLPLMTEKAKLFCIEGFIAMNPNYTTLSPYLKDCIQDKLAHGYENNTNYRQQSYNISRLQNFNLKYSDLSTNLKNALQQAIIRKLISGNHIGLSSTLNKLIALGMKSIDLSDQLQREISNYMTKYQNNLQSQPKSDQQAIESSLHSIYKIAFATKNI